MVNKILEIDQYKIITYEFMNIDFYHSKSITNLINQTRDTISNT